MTARPRKPQLHRKQTTTAEPCGRPGDEMPRWYDANAKVNLALHVTGRRADGYHLIETIVVFTELGDRVFVAECEQDALTISGPEAGDLDNDDPAANLAVKARDFLRRVLAERGVSTPPVSITLEKHLPSGSGIGGGSADAAATIRALADLWGASGIGGSIGPGSVEIGADLPMCLENRPLRAAGIGEEIEPIATVPEMPMVLANPRRHVATPAVFEALEGRQNPPLPDLHDTARKSASDWADWLSTQTRNDLQAAAIAIAPPIRTCLDAIAGTGARFTRMSGSGATCFGIFDSATAARKAAAQLQAEYPDWWITATASRPSPEPDGASHEQN